MKKTITKLACLSACSLLLFSCGDKSNPTYDDPHRHYVKNTIHDLNYDYSKGKTFVVDGETDYYIATIENEFALKIADYMAKQIRLATGTNIEVRKIADTEVIASSEKAIIVGSNASFEAASLTKTDKKIGGTGYQIKTKDNAVYLITKGNSGFQLAGLKFLELTIGYDLIYGDYIVYDLDGSKIPEMDIVERPDFDYRKIDDNDTTWRYGAGFTDNQIFMTVDGIQYHNSYKYLPPATYYAEHPNWYNQYGANELLGQLCYTAHSHPEEVPLMEEICAEKMISVLEANPNLDNVTFTIQDNYNMCECYGDESKGYSNTNPDPNSCTGKNKHYNGSNAGVVIEFVNAIDDIVQEHFKDSGRDIFISFFAYHATEIAPTKEVDGQIQLIDGLKTNPNVCAFIAPISSNYINSFYDTDKNLDVYNKYQNWKKVSSNLYTWIYETSFGEYLYPFNTFTSMHETYRFLKEQGVSMLYNQGQHGNSCRTAFNRLKLYISSKLMINVNLDVKDIISKYFESYYRDGATYMKEFYEEMVSWTLYQEKQWPEVFTGHVSSGNHYLATADYWNEGQLNKWEKLVYKAIDSVSSIKEQDPYLYTQITDAMLVESIFPRWALCNLFESSYSDTALLQKRQAFKDDATRLNVDEYAETKSLQDFYTQSWGI